MCGIAGIVNFDGRPVETAALARMHQTMAHRGPDGEGIYCSGAVGLAHRRLAIIDPAAGIQPFYSADRQVVLSYNGEVYNFIELRKELEGDGPFTTHSDTEVVLRAYEKWGIACLQRFRGMFAFALYDGRRQRLYLVRDRVGIKPLFYYRTPQQLVFASEIRPILRVEGVRRDILPASVSGFFRYQYVPAPATIYRDLFKLEPGHYLDVATRTGQMLNRSYWELTVNLSHRPEADRLEELNALLDDTLRLYVRSDVPFGAFLSGGVDSSLVTALMARQLEAPVRTFTIGFREEQHSELPFAAEASRIVGTTHCEKIVSPDLAEAILASVVEHFGEPFADSSAIPTYYVSRESARHVKMVLSGDGGDELFAGYNSYQSTFREYGGVAAHPGVILWGVLARWGLSAALKQRARHRRTDAFQRGHDAQRQIFDDATLRTLLTLAAPPAPAVGFHVNIESQELDPVTLFQAQDFKTYLVDDVLTKVDRMSMAHSLEVRVPLLDHRLVEMAFTLPLSLKLRLAGLAGQVETKYLLKRSAARFFPESFLARPKQGFGIPLVEWCRGPLRPLLESRLRRAENPIYQWVQEAYVRRSLDEFFGGQDNLAVRLWFIFVFDLWMTHVHARA